jgi:hypothetical protein
MADGTVGYACGRRPATGVASRARPGVSPYLLLRRWSLGLPRSDSVRHRSAVRNRAYLRKPPLPRRQGVQNPCPKSTSHNEGRPRVLQPPTRWTAAGCLRLHRPVGCIAAARGRDLMVTERRQAVGKRALTGHQESVSLPRRRSEVTWENGVEHSGSLCFADTEGVTGSNPVAPTSTNGSLDSRLVVACQRFASKPLNVVALSRYGVDHLGNSGSMHRSSFMPGSSPAAHLLNWRRSGARRSPSPGRRGGGAAWFADGTEIAVGAHQPQTPRAAP